MSNDNLIIGIVGGIWSLLVGYGIWPTRPIDEKSWRRRRLYKIGGYTMLAATAFGLILRILGVPVYH